MSYDFMKDTIYNEFNQTKLDNLYQLLGLIQLRVNKKWQSLSESKQSNINQRLLSNGLQVPIQPIKDFNQFIKDNQIMKNIGDSLFSNFGKNGKGLPLGLISTSVKLTSGKNGNVKIDKTKSKTHIEHFLPKGLVGTKLVIFDCMMKVWQFEELLDGSCGKLIKGQTYIENTYPQFHLTTITTDLENYALKTEVNMIVKSETDPVTGITNWDNVKDRLLNGEHYKNVGITFYDEFISLGGNQIYPHLAPQSLRDLMGKKKTKVQKHNFF